LSYLLLYCSHNLHYGNWRSQDDWLEANSTLQLLCDSEAKHQKSAFLQSFEVTDQSQTTAQEEISDVASMNLQATKY
jgi:hypothetical protein